MTSPSRSGRHSATPLRTAATSECVVPRSMPTACRRACGSGEVPGSEICRSATRFSLPARRGAARRRSRSARRTSARAPRAPPAPGRGGRRARRRGAGTRLRRSVSSSCATASTSARDPASSSDSRHAICWSRNSAGIAVLSSARTDTPRELAQVGGALERIAEPLVRLVDAHRPLHRRPSRRGVGGREAVGVHLGLERSPARVELAAVKREPARQPEQREVVDGERRVHETRRARAAGPPIPSEAPLREARQTRNDSPQPQRSFSRGLWNLKPSFRPSRTKSSWVPSR